MDRNIFLVLGCPLLHRVALLAEGVDRNLLALQWLPVAWVALLAEGVDRNYVTSEYQRRDDFVALLAEGVDRN